MNDNRKEDANPVPATRIEAELWQLLARISGNNPETAVLHSRSPQVQEFLLAILRCAVQSTLNLTCASEVPRWSSPRMCPPLRQVTRRLVEARAELLLHQLEDDAARLQGDIEAAEIIAVRWL